MEGKIILATAAEFMQYLQPIVVRLEKIEAFFLGNTNEKNNPVYTETEAAHYLKCSKKKLQILRNAREIGFIRENGGRKILYKHRHLQEYLEEHEMKKKK